MYIGVYFSVILILLIAGLPKAVVTLDMTGLALLFIKTAITSLPVFALIEGESMDQPLDVASRLPVFDNTTRNLTVTAGTRATLHCAVDNKGDYKVIWLNPRKTLISTDDSRFIDDSRISVERPDIPDWNLMIREVRYNDSGEYMCQINTKPVRIKRIHLFVNVPPEIIDDWSNPKIEIVEGSTVELVCNATGVPTPSVTWYKKDDKITDYNDYGYCLTGAIPLEGEILILHNVSRYCDGIYECRADNNVQPMANKQFEVVVRFAPEVRLSVTRMGQYLHKETMLECRVSASPFSELTWKKNGTDLSLVSQSRKKHWIDVYDQREHEKILYLNIIDLEPEDYGYYECAASNSLGHDSEFMLLYEYPGTTTSKPSAKQSTDRTFTTPLFQGRYFDPKYDPSGQGKLGGSVSFNYNSASRATVTLTLNKLLVLFLLCRAIYQRISNTAMA